ncbi:MAG: asparagine--tRNA ligase, partial [Thaumarchaeota archaeon]
MLKRFFVEDALKAEEDDEVELLGWVRNKRAHGGLIFLDLRDSTGIIQVALKKGIADDESFRAAEELKLESEIRFRGIVKHDPRAPTGVEIRCKRVEVLGP